MTNPVELVSQPEKELAPQPKRSVLMPLLVGLVVVGLATLTGYLYYQNSQLKAQLSDLSPTPTPQLNNEVKDPTENWKDYTGKIFSFRYPAEMIIRIEDIRDPRNPINQGENVLIEDDKYQIKVASDFMGGWGGSVCLITKDQKIAGFDSQILYFRKSVPGTETCLDEYIDLVALVNNATFDHPYPIIIEMKSKQNNKAIDTIVFDQILSTIKLTQNAKQPEGEIKAIFDSINQSFGLNLIPVEVNEFYSRDGFINQKAWKLDLTRVLTEKSKITTLMQILEKKMTQDINSSADGVGQSVQGYENASVYCYLLRGFNQSDYISCREK